MFAELVQTEQEQVAAGQAEPCGQVCDDGCHGPVRCVRARHPHDPAADMGVDAAGRVRMPGDVAPHVGYDQDGALLQWTCLPGDHDGLTDGERTAKREADTASARGAATKAMYGVIDPKLLVEMLRSDGHL